MKKGIILDLVNSKDFLTVEEAANFLNIKSQAIRNYLSTKKLTTYKFKNQTLLSRKELEDWKRNKQR